MTESGIGSALRPERSTRDPGEEHFLKVDREEAEPETVAERAWVRLKGRREYELEAQITPPPVPAENYGIVEWDADRCWW